MTGNRLLDLLVWSAALISALALVGAAYQFIANRLAEKKYPPPGRLVDVGGYRLHLHCSGPEGADAGRNADRRSVILRPEGTACCPHGRVVFPPGEE